MSTADGLQKSVGLFGAVALALGIVVGAGMLTLPGLVFQETGGWAAFAWLLDAALLFAAPYAVRRLHAAVNPTLGEAGK